VVEIISQTRYSGLCIKYDDSLHPWFNSLAQEAIAVIACKPVGQRLLADIHDAPMPSGSTFKVQVLCPKAITATDGPVDFSPGSKAVRGNEDRAVSQFGHPPSQGTGTAVLWNPNVINTPDGARPSFIALAHELIHARRNLLGIARRDAQEEEEYTVGFNLQGDGVNENAIRAEHGIPLRATYSGDGWVARDPFAAFNYLKPLISTGTQKGRS
jgi:hypothetical protein